jgi:hypothetical protein
MDEDTKQYYRENFNYSDFTPICIETPKPCPTKICPPPWNGWGSPEDSLQSWLHIVPVKPKFDQVKELVLDKKVLKYGAVLDSTKPEDQGREFVITYRLQDDKIGVYETPIQNSGWRGGRFLEFLRMIKPGSSQDCPEYYAPWDLYVGALLDFYGHRFLVKCAHPFVLEFINTNPDCFPEHVKQNIRQYFEEHEKQHGSCENEKRKTCDPGPPVCEEPLREGFFEHLGMGLSHHFTGNQFRPCDENPYPFPCNYEWSKYDHGDDPSLNPSVGDPNCFEQGDSNAVCTPQQYYYPAPVMQNPVLCEEPQCINPDEYYPLKEHRFDTQNLSEDESKWRSNTHLTTSSIGFSPPPQDQMPFYPHRSMLTQAPNTFLCRNCGSNSNPCTCSTSSTS